MVQKLYTARIIQFISRIIFFLRGNYCEVDFQFSLPRGTHVATTSLLKRGKHYELITDFTCEPQDSVLIKMEFYERSGKLMETCVFEGKGGDVTYPMGAYFYSISLINMGMRELLFKK